MQVFFDLYLHLYKEKFHLYINQLTYKHSHTNKLNSNSNMIRFFVYVHKEQNYRG